MYVKWNRYANSFNSSIKPFRRFGGNINVKVDLLNYAAKTDLKNAMHVDTSSFAIKKNFASLKT